MALYDAYTQPECSVVSRTETELTFRIGSTQYTTWTSLAAYALLWMAKDVRSQERYASLTAVLVREIRQYPEKYALPTGCEETAGVARAHAAALYAFVEGSQRDLEALKVLGNRGTKTLFARHAQLLSWTGSSEWVQRLLWALGFFRDCSIVAMGLAAFCTPRAAAVTQGAIFWGWPILKVSLFDSSLRFPLAVTYIDRVGLGLSALATLCRPLMPAMYRIGTWIASWARCQTDADYVSLPNETVPGLEAPGPQVPEPVTASQPNPTPARGEKRAADGPCACGCTCVVDSSVESVKVARSCADNHLYLEVGELCGYCGATGPMDLGDLDDALGATESKGGEDYVPSSPAFPPPALGCGAGAGDSTGSCVSDLNRYLPGPAAESPRYVPGEIAVWHGSYGLTAVRSTQQWRPTAKWLNANVLPHMGTVTTGVFGFGVIEGPNASLPYNQRPGRWYVNRFETTCVAKQLPQGEQGKVPTLRDLTNPEIFDPEKPGQFVAIGPICASALPLVFAQSPRNELVSLCNRHLAAQANTRAQVMFWKSAEAFVEGLYQAIFPFYTPPDFEAWLAVQVPTLRERYKKWLEALPRQKQAKDHYRKAFLKVELLLPCEGGRVAKAPRLIQGLGKCEMNTALGCFISSISKAWKRSIEHHLTHDTMRVVYTAGFTRLQLGELYHRWVSDGYEVYEDDFSAYDSSIGEGATWVEQTFFKKFKPDGAAAYALEQQKFSKGFSTWYRYTVPFTRKSGDQNTSLGNSVVNAAAHALCMDRMGVVDYRMFVMGDDNLLFVKGLSPPQRRTFCANVAQIMTELGLSSKVQQRQFPMYCSAEFMPVTVDGRETMCLVPLVTRKLAKFGWSARPLHKHEDILMRLKSNEMSCKVHSLMPVARVVNGYYRDLDGTVVENQDFVAHEDPACRVEPSTHTMSWFCEVYGVTAIEVAELEEFLAGALHMSQGTACVWGHPVFDKMLETRGF